MDHDEPTKHDDKGQGDNIRAYDNAVSVERPLMVYDRRGIRFGGGGPDGHRQQPENIVGDNSSCVVCCKIGIGGKVNGA
ncbi:hypothetical protein ACET3Z_033202 [Daucus carota]